MKNERSTKMTADEQARLLDILKIRFRKNPERHKDLEWAKVQSRLDDHPGKLWPLGQMEATGGEPDVVGYDKKTGEFIFMDCSPESPKDRRSLCYDGPALESRKENKPKGSAMETAEAMGIELLSEDEYRRLQELGDFDCKTSSWVRTPADIRKLGGAIFGDRRFGLIFIYHNGAESYYAARGFRGSLRV